MDRPENPALGFVLATDDALPLVERNSDAQVRLAAGEAAFVPEGTRQLQFALGDGATTEQEAQYGTDPLDPSDPPGEGP